MVRKNISKKDIKDFWWPYLVAIGKFDSKKEVFEEDYCFACGYLPFGNAIIERAHIHALVENGPDVRSNIHLLCSRCHSISEGLTSITYFIWFINWNMERLKEHILATIGKTAMADVVSYWSMSKRRDCCE